jgi:hypothetical protein
MSGSALWGLPQAIGPRCTYRGPLARGSAYITTEPNPATANGEVPGCPSTPGCEFLTPSRRTTMAQSEGNPRDSNSPARSKLPKYMRMRRPCLAFAPAWLDLYWSSATSGDDSSDDSSFDSSGAGAESAGDGPQGKSGGIDQGCSRAKTAASTPPAAVSHRTRETHRETRKLNGGCSAVECPQGRQKPRSVAP